MRKDRGVLIANGFLKSAKFTEHYEWLMQAAEDNGMELDYIENSACMAKIDGCFNWLSQYDFILYWDKDIRLGQLLQYHARAKGIPMYNDIEGIASCDDKFLTYCRVSAWNACQKGRSVQLLPTIAAPMTYENIGYSSMDFVEDIIRELGLPVVIKECFGSFGQQVYLAESLEEAQEITRRLAGKPFLYQSYLEQSAGKDVRLQVVGDQVVAGMYRYSLNGDFRANVTNGGRMESYVPSPQEEALAVHAVKALGLDFAGVDLLFSEGRKGHADVLCEVNSNAHFKNIYSCTGINVARCIMEYIKQKKRE